MSRDFKLNPNAKAGLKGGDLKTVTATLSFTGRSGDRYKWNLGGTLGSKKLSNRSCYSRTPDKPPLKDATNQLKGLVVEKLNAFSKSDVRFEDFGKWE